MRVDLGGQAGKGSRGCSHARALRGVQDRLLRALVAMLERGTLYDPERRRLPGPVPASSTHENETAGMVSRSASPSLPTTALCHG